MEFKGNIKDISRNWDSNRLVITFDVTEMLVDGLEQLRNKALTVVAKQYRNKRSLDANAYYWQLVTKLADCLGESKPFIHNRMLRRYGQPEIIDGKLVYAVVPESEEGTDIADQAETYHIKPTSQTKEGNDGSVFRTYIMLRGSSTYDTNEMSKLIHGIVAECKEQGIETMTPDKLDEMMCLFDQNRRKRD